MGVEPLPRERRLEGVTLAGAAILVELIGRSSEVERALLARRFHESARGFEETVRFLDAIGAVRNSGRTIDRGDRLTKLQATLAETRQLFDEQLIRHALQSSTPYAKEFKEVLSEFSLKSGEAHIKSTKLSEGNYAARNLFLEAGIMKLDHETGAYTLGSKFGAEFIEAKYGQGTLPEELDRLAKQQVEIGLATELKIMEYEQALVGPRDAENVVHVALKNAGAGFDIASMRRERKTDAIEWRMIEVKAVSRSDWRFILTHNERRVATEAEDIYFLYLVPVKEGEPEVERMQVIQSPMKELSNSGHWTVEEGDWSIARTPGHG